jgi:hypothetical protein
VHGKGFDSACLVGIHCVSLEKYLELVVGENVGKDLKEDERFGFEKLSLVR